MWKLLLQVIIFPLPWPLRRKALQLIFGYQFKEGARLGYSIINSKTLELGPGARIGNLTIIKGLNRVQLGKEARIGSLNWITAFPIGTSSLHFANQLDRDPSLIVGDHSAITGRHLIDCTGGVTVGTFTTVAGFRSQILTHSIDINKSMQHAQPIIIGDYCFVGTSSILLPGSRIPNYSVLGAGSVLNKWHETEYTLYAGSPARAVKKLALDIKYFHRAKGFII